MRRRARSGRRSWRSGLGRGHEPLARKPDDVESFERRGERSTPRSLRGGSRRGSCATNAPPSAGSGATGTTARHGPRAHARQAPAGAATTGTAPWQSPRRVAAAVVVAAVAGARLGETRPGVQTRRLRNASRSGDRGDGADEPADARGNGRRDRAPGGDPDRRVAARRAAQPCAEVAGRPERDQRRDRGCRPVQVLGSSRRPALAAPHPLRRQRRRRRGLKRPRQPPLVEAELVRVSASSAPWRDGVSATSLARAGARPRCS